VSGTDNTLTKKEMELVKKAVVYSSDDDLRPVMTCVYIDKEHIIGTDAHILCKYKREKEQDFTYMIPKKTVSFLDNTDYNVLSGEEYILLQDDKYSYYFRKKDGRYPDYNAVIPQIEGTKTFFEIKSADLLSVCDSASIVINKGADLIIFDINAETGVVNFKAEDKDIGNSFNKEISCDVEGKDLEIGFGANKLIKILKNEKWDSCLFMLTDSNRCAFINEEIVLMPMMMVN
jgi:DNA polymerase III subunit beta